MSGDFVSKFRLVKCPKCRVLLQENPKYNVYSCGGCGTILQANNRRRVAANSESSTQETTAAPRNAPVPPRENGLKAKANSSSSRDSSLDGNAGRGQRKNGKSNGELLEPFSLSDEELESELDIYKLTHRRRRVSNKGSSNKTSHCEIEEIHNASDENGTNEKSAQVGVKSEMEIIESGLEGSKLLDGNLSLERAQEVLVSGSDCEDANNDISDMVGANPEVEINRNDLEGSEDLSNGNLLPAGAEKQLNSGSDGEDADKDKLTLAGANPEMETAGSYSEGAKELNSGKLSLKGTEEELVSGLDGDVGNEKSALVGENLEVEISGRNIEEEELNSGKLLSDGTEEELSALALGVDDPNIEQLVSVGSNPEVDITVRASATKRSSNEIFVSEKRSILPVTPGKLEDGTSANPVSSNKQQRESQQNIQKSFDRVKFVDTLDSPKPSGIHGELYKSRTTRWYPGYDGSVSVCTAKDERFPIQQLDSFENTNMVANGVSEGRSRKGKVLVNSMLYGDHGTQHQPYLPNGKHNVVKDRIRNQNRLLETEKHGHQHWMRTKRDEFPSRIHVHQSGFQSHYERGTPSNQLHDETDSCEDNDQEKMKLLRMVHKLQDQLNRTRSASRKTNRRFPIGFSYKGKHVPAYHNHDLHGGIFSHDMDYPIPTCNGRCTHGSNLHQRHKFSRIPYSAEVTSSAHHADHSCFHYYPHKQHFSADLLQREELYRSYPGRDCCSLNSTPQRFKTSQLPVYDHETNSDDQRYMLPKVKKHLKRKPNSPKRYYKPVAGGAPFVTCHKCLKLLHLPADFLLLKRVDALAEKEKITSRHSCTSKAPVETDQSAELSSNMTFAESSNIFVLRKGGKVTTKKFITHKLVGENHFLKVKRSRKRGIILNRTKMFGESKLRMGEN
ncbi:hypothetical protein TanjilG_00465 [Lupinus angustifolius]|uniref:Uncharacterized protein n=1 Tax=Lupinus angustifolius TaxID=3871 RepID=A0A4P1QXE8_LUPAN|nr:hypothetical protein TanjilG_00465 [Lupinus angustifolius]